jgi:peroxin-3
MFSNSRYDPHRRRNNRRHLGPPTGQHLLTHITTIAVVAYGAYRVGSWAWNNVFRPQDDDDNKNNDDVYATKNSDEDGDGDLLQEWASSENYSSSPMRRTIRAEARRVMARDDERLVELNNNSSNGVEYIGDVVVGESSSAVVNDEYDRNNGQTNNRLGRSHGHSHPPQDYQRHQCHPQINDRERISRMARCRLESSRAMLDFLPTMKGAIAKETDVSRETDELKELRAEKREINEMKKQQVSVNDDDGTYNESKLEVIKGREQYLWNSIKNKSLTRLITTVYAHTIIYLTLNVQVNLLGGRLLRDEYEEQHASTSLEGAGNRYRSSHEIVLSKTYHHLFAIGIPSIANVVGKEVTRMLQVWDVLNDDVTIQDVSSWLQSIRAGIEHQRRRREEGVSSSALVQFVIGQESKDSDDSTTDELARYILDETYDLLESPTFAIAERDCLDATFDQLYKSMLSTLFAGKDQQIPVVNVVTHMQKAAVLTFHKPLSHRNEASNPNAYIPNLERLDAVQELSNVCF